MRLAPQLMLLIPLLAVGAALPSEGQPSIAFTSDAVVASHITPGAQAAWFSVAWDRFQGTNRVTRRERIDSEDGGTVTFEMDGGVPANSIWVVVDLGTGDYAVAMPDQSRLRFGELPEGAFQRASTDDSDVLAVDRNFIDFFVARPRVGAWVRSVGHRGASDVGRGNDQFTRASLAAMRAVGRSGDAPKHLTPGDVAILIDPYAMECFGTKMGAER